MDKKTIAKNFSRYAHLYDSYANIQSESIPGLLEYVKKSDFCDILEIGCGTGNYTLALKNKFKQAKINAFDISVKMIELAEEKLKEERVKFSVADAENVTFSDRFDLITSNACFQWFLDLEKALAGYKEQLKTDGVILFSIFGPLTFYELSASLKSVSKGASIPAGKFTSKENLKAMLDKYFRQAQIKEFRCEEKFLSLKDLLYKIKYSGIRGSGIGNGLRLCRRALEELESCYLEKFGRIRATYQVFFCKGER